MNAAPLTAGEIAARLGLRRTGPRDWNGPCPLCGGRDRFHVRDGDGRGLVGCRVCMDGQPEHEKRARYGEVMALLRGEGLNGRPRISAPPQRTTQSRPMPTEQDRQAVARRIWHDAAPIPTDPEHPARLWFEAWSVWPPDAPVPPSLQWLDSGAFREEWEGKPAAGAIVAALKPPHGRLSAVQLIYVADDGSAAYYLQRGKRRNKRSHGVQVNAVGVIGIPDSANGISVAEGLKTALVAAVQMPEPAVMMGGTHNYARPDLARWLAELGPVQILMDSDENRAGERAARRLGLNIENEGGSVTIIEPTAGSDFAEAGIQLPQETPDSLDFAADLERDGLPAWEARRIAWTTTGGAHV